MDCVCHCAMSDDWVVFLLLAEFAEMSRSCVTLRVAGCFCCERDTQHVYNAAMNVLDHEVYFSRIESSLTPPLFFSEELLHGFTLSLVEQLHSDDIKLAKGI